MQKIYQLFVKYKSWYAILFLAILIEVFVCNGTSLRTLLVNKRNKEIAFTMNEELPYFTENVKLPPTNKDYKAYGKAITIENFPEDIYSFNFYIDSDEKVNATIFLKIESIDPVTNIQKIQTLSEKTVTLSKKGAYLNTYINKEQTSHAIINFYFYNQDITIDRIVVNQCNFSFCFLRAMLIFGILLLFYQMKNKRIEQLRYQKDDTKQKILFWGIVTSILTLLSVLYGCEHFCYPEKVTVDPYDTEEAMILQAEALRNGQLAFLLEPDERFQNMKNPYDISARYYYNTDYVFDTAYYNEKFYQYFSILPVLFFILPFRLITGFYVTTKVFNTILFILLLFLLSLLYQKTVNWFIKEISFFHYIVGYMTLIFGSNVINYARGLMYDIPVIFGLISLIIALLILMGLLQNTKKSYLKLVIAGIFTGFVVMSKPSLIGYYLIIFYLLIPFFKQELSQKKKSIWLKELVAFFLPLYLLGIIQMWLNNIRFGSIFEFGAVYQLTVADMQSHTGFTFPGFIKGAIKFLFTLPHINLREFPFINTYNNLYDYMGFNEYEYENSVAGILCIPVIWLLFLKKKIQKQYPMDKKLGELLSVILLTATILLTIVICFAGAAEAYSMDIKVMLVFGAILVGLKLLEQTYPDQNKDYQINRFLYILLCFLSILLVMPQSISTEGSLLENSYMPINIYLSHFFEFWT